MKKANTKNYKVIALLAVLLTGVVLTNGCASGGPPLEVPGVPTQCLKGSIFNTSSGKEYYVIKETMLAFGGQPFEKYEWSNHASMPAGTTFEPFTGIFKGQGGILLPGTQTFDMTVSDGHKTATGKFTFVVTTYNEFFPVADFQQPSISSIVLPDAYTGYGYGASLWALGDGALPWSWSLYDGELPPGLMIDNASGIVRGEPASEAAGNTYNFTITVRDANQGEALVMIRPTYTITVTK